MSELLAYLSRGRKDGHATKMLLLNLCTAVGMYGGFPPVPRVVGELLQHEVVQWTMLTVLIYQGGGEQNWQLAGELTICFYLLHLALRQADARLGASEAEVADEDGPA